MRVPYSSEAGLRVVAAGRARLFEEHQKMSVIDIIKNPMVLMMVVPIALVFMMTKLTGNLSPEELVVRCSHVCVGLGVGVVLPI